MASLVTTTVAGNVTLTNATPQVILTDTLTDPDKTWALKVNNNSFYITETGVADILTIAAGGATTFSGALTGTSATFTGALTASAGATITKGSGLAASITNTDGTGGYGLAVESDGTGNTRYNLMLRNPAGSVIYGGVSTMTNQVGYWGIGVTPTGALHSRLTVNGNACPSANNSHYVGTSSYRWAGVYATVGNFSGAVTIGNNVPMWSGSYGGALVLKGNNATADRYAQLAIVDSTGALINTGLVVANSGNVGIGTTDPGSYKLKVEGTTWFNDQTFIAGNNTAPPATSNSQDFGAIRMSDGTLRSMYQGCTATYGWISVSKSTDHSVNYPLVLNPNGGAVGIGTDISNLTGGALLCVGGVQDVSSSAIAQFGSSASDFMRCGWYISQQTGSNPALRPNATGFNGDIGSDANSFSKLWCSGWSVRKTTAAGEMRSRLDSGYPGLEFVDQATGGDMSWCIGGHDRGGVGQPGQNAFIFKYLRGTRFNESWYDEGTEAMCIDDSGNVGIGYINPGAKLAVGGSVGIGTTAPDSKLMIQGGGYNSSLKIKGSASHTGIQFVDSGNTTDGYVYAAELSVGLLDAGTHWTIQCKNNDFIRFSTNDDTEHMRIKSDGNVGIGDTTPTYKLDVNGTFRSTGAAYFNGASYTTGQAYLNGGLRIGGANANFAGERLFTMPSFANGVANQKIDLYWTGAFWGYLEIEITSGYSNQNASGVVTKSFSFGANASNAIYLNESWYSNVGGLTNNNFAISGVTWDSTNSRYRIQIVHRVSTGNDLRLKLRCLGQSAAHADTFMSGTTVSAVYTTDTTAFALPVKQLAAPNDNAWVDGYLGIGTSTPSAPLHVHNSASILAYFTRPSAGPSIHVGSSTTAGARMGYTLSYDIATFGHDAVSEAIAVKSDGKVGIGTTDPSQPLHVNGASLLGGTTTIGGNLVPAISTLMDIGTSSFKWRNLVLSGTAGIGGALTGTTATFSGNVTGANVYTEAGGQVRAYRGSGGSSYGSLSMDTGETLHLANSWSGKKLSLTRDGDLQLSGTTVIDASRNLTNIGTISSGAITTTGALTGTTATFSGQVKTTNQFRISADYAVQYFYKANNSTMLGYLLMRDDETNYLSTAGGQDFAIVDTVTNTRWITFQTSTKNVGIGTTDPGTYKLKVEGTTWLNDVTFIAGNNTAPPTTSNSQDFGAIRMSDGALRSMYQGCTATYGWIQVMSSTNHATNYPLALNPNGGSVGIGTNAPAAPLDVHGSMVRISSDGGAYRRLMFFDSLATPSKNNFQVAVQEINNALHIGPSTAVGGTTFSGSTGLAMLANGSVGIGDASPSYKLDVNGTGRFTGALSSGAITVDTSGGTDNYYLTCKEAGTARFSIYENANNVYLNAFTSLNLRANQIGGSGGQIGLYGGPVVIGETLAVTGALTGTSATFSGGSVGWYNAASIRGHLGMTGNEGDLSIYRSNTVKHVYLSSYYDSYINPAIGNVGIGTTNPGTWKLRVEGTGFFNGSVVVPNGSSYFGAYNSSGVLKSLIYLSSSNEVIINKDHLSAQPTKIRGKYITFETPDSVLGADIEVMRVFQGSGFMTAGCVGIGVTTPSSKLDVNGTITGTSKNFNIPHPDPSKINARLIHASIEAPSNDTLYKFEVVISLDNETVTHPLPSYFKYLNKNPRMWIQARDMFSHAYGSCAEDLSSFSITGEKAGNYDVLIIATRKDEGVEGFVVEIDA